MCVLSLWPNNNQPTFPLCDCSFEVVGGLFVNVKVAWHNWTPSELLYILWYPKLSGAEQNYSQTCIRPPPTQTVELIVWLSNDWTVRQRARPTGGLCGCPKNAPLAPLTQFPNLLSPPHTTHKHCCWVDKNIRRRSELELGSKLLLLLLLSPVEITGWNSFTWGWMTVLFANSILLHCTLVSTLH